MLHISSLQLSFFLDAHRDVVRSSIVDDMNKVISTVRQLMTPQMENKYHVVVCFDRSTQKSIVKGKNESYYTICVYPKDGYPDVSIGTIRQVPYRLLMEIIGPESARCVLRFNRPVDIILTI